MELSVRKTANLPRLNERIFVHDSPAQNLQKRKHYTKVQMT